MVDFGKRNFHNGQGEWQAMTRNGGNRWVFSRSPSARVCTKSAEYFFAIVVNCELSVLVVKADFGDISEVMKDTVSKQDRVGGRMGNIENTMANLEDMFAIYLARAGIIFSGSEMAGRAKMLKGISENWKIERVRRMYNAFERRAWGIRK